MISKKIATVVIASAMTLGTITAVSADPGHTVGVPPQVTTVLSSLVANKTITQSQADAITAALTAAAPAAAPKIGGKGPSGHMGPKGGMGGFGMNSAARQAIITSTLGITAADLQAARQAGKSLATLAGDKTTALITALVNYETTQIDAAVTAGTLSAAQAATMKANLSAHITAEVNEAAHGPKMGAAPKIPTSSTTGAKTTIKRVTIKTVSSHKA